MTGPTGFSLRELHVGDVVVVVVVVEYVDSVPLSVLDIAASSR